jgi:hypothetical protein
MDLNRLQVATPCRTLLHGSTLVILFPVHFLVSTEKPKNPKAALLALNPKLSLEYHVIQKTYNGFPS